MPLQLQSRADRGSALNLMQSLPMAIRLTAGINLVTIAILVIVAIILPHDNGGGFYTNLDNILAGFAAACTSVSAIIASALVHFANKSTPPNIVLLDLASVLFLLPPLAIPIAVSWLF
jgi:hypothetical protein